MSVALLRQRHHRVLVYLDVIFCGYCVAMIVAAALAWWHGRGTLQTIASLLAFILVNIVISQISRRVSRPVLAEFGRFVVGTIIAVLTYLTTGGPFGMLWAGFLIMALGGTVFFGLLTGSAAPGRAITGYYAGALFLTEYFANPHPNWYAFVVGAGAIVMVGFLIAEIVAMLEQALRAERDQKEALVVEKARSEQLLHEQAEAALRANEERIRMEMDRAFRAIVEGTAGTIGGDFLMSLVEHLATGLEVDHSFVAELVDSSRGRVRTTAFWSRGRIVPNVEYDLAGTPCESVVAGKMCYHQDGVQQAFPADRDLVTLGAQSYLGMPLHDAAGEVLGHIAVLDNRPMRDEERRREILTVFAARAGAELERQRSERALRTLNSELEARVDERTAELQSALDERSRLAAVLESTAEIVGMASMDGRVLYMNRAGRQRLGLGLDEDIRGYDMFAYYTPASAAFVVREGIPYAMAHGTWSGELVMVSRHGEEIPVWLSGTAHRGPDGSPRFVSCIARDISERKRVEMELQSAKETAEAASRAKSTFLATMSHEIRTPMNAVIGMTDLLLTTALSPKQREFVETVRSSGDALLTVINDILDFSKIEAGKLELEHRAFDLRTAVESVVDLLAPRAAQKGLELALLVEPTVPAVVVGDETRLRQIVLNLVGNGLKFTEHGEVVVSVAARAVDSAQLELHVAVRDTGIGIPPNKRDRLFASFGQLDPSTTREFGGTGLGLAITKRLVELMNGTIWVESDGVPGRGSVFQFTIRVAQGAADNRPSQPARQPALAGRRALVVDDNATNRHILGLQLQAWGMLAVQAALPSAAIDLLRRGDRFDVVLLDMQMPGMDGVSLAKAICAQRGSARLPIVMLTSLGRDLGADAERTPCFAGSLTKPVKPSQLYDTILGALVGRDVTPEAAVHVPSRTAPARAQPAPLRILLAEDLEVNRRFALLALEELGYRADVAVNGREVLRALERADYDVVLMDVQMPEMDGLDATRSIRRDWSTNRQPHIVAMTANAMQGDREICLEAGMDDYLSKPVYLEELGHVLERAAARVATWSTPTTAPATIDHDSVDWAIVNRLLARPNGRELLEIFVAEANDTMRQLRLAIDERDVVRVRDAAHRLKGSAGYVGASRIASLSDQIESTARSGHIVEASRIELLEEDLLKLRDRLLPALKA